MSTIIVDTETSGLPILKGFNNYYDPILTTYYDSSRIIELGYIVYDFKQNFKFKRNFLIKPDKFIVTNTNIHGITMEELNKNGMSIIDALEILECDLEDVSLFVAHNLNFDYNIILSEAYRCNKFSLIEKLKNVSQECTMKMGQKFLNQKKYPKLQFLHSYFNPTKKIQTHRAIDDAEMCANCYYNMKNNIKK